MAQKEAKSSNNPISLTPEQQDQLDMFMANATKIIHAKGTTEQLIKQMEVTPNKAEAVGRIVVNITEKLESTAEASGANLDPIPVLAGALAIMNELVTIGVATGKMERFDEEQTKEVVGYTVGLYLDNALKAGKITKEELVAVAQQLQNDPGLQEEMGGVEEGEEIGESDGMAEEQMPMPGGGMITDEDEEVPRGATQAPRGGMY